MTKRTCQFPKHTCLREINFLKIAGISLLLFCTTSQIAVADSYEKNAVTATQQSKTEKITGKIFDQASSPFYTPFSTPLIINLIQMVKVLKELGKNHKLFC